MADITEFNSYSDMFREYLAGENWIGPSTLPLVHHIRQLCAQLDSAGLDKAALASAYVQAVEKLERRRPKPAGSSAGVEGDLPGQGSIFDELDDEG